MSKRKKGQGAKKGGKSTSKKPRKPGVINTESRSLANVRWKGWRTRGPSSPVRIYHEPPPEETSTD